MGCVLDSSCISLSIDDEGALHPGWIFHPDSAVECGPAGLFVRKLMTQIGCVATDDEVVFPSFGSTVSQFSPIVTVTNPSAVRNMVLNSAVLFGTPQINVKDGGAITVVDLIGRAGAGSLNPSSYTTVNSCEVVDHPTFPNGTEIAFNAQAAQLWNCTFTIGPLQAIDVQFERRALLGGQLTGNGSVLLRGTFMFLWGVVT